MALVCYDISLLEVRIGLIFRFWDVKVRSLDIIVTDGQMDRWTDGQQCA